MSVSDQGELSKEWGDPEQSQVGAAIGYMVTLWSAYFAGLISGLLLGWIGWH